MTARICVVGGGLAGSLLAWRLAHAGGGRIDLALGPWAGAADGAHAADATAVSGGLVRGYEPDVAASAAAIASLVELRESPTLRLWSEYREVGSVYVRDSPTWPYPQLGMIERELPGSADVLSAAELAARGWADLPAYCTAVSERDAGYLSPTALRRSLLADLRGRRDVDVQPGSVGLLGMRAGGLVRCRTAAGERDYDVVAIAAGRWTGGLLRRSGLPHAGLRTKSIQCAVYPAAGWRPPPFVDETSGLYGRPVGGGAVLLGIPVQRWDVDPDLPPDDPEPHDAALRWAAIRFPRLRLGAPLRRVAAADSYSGRGMLSLAPVAGTDDRIFTFAGGLGGSVKTALAASRQAATDLAAGPDRRHRRNTPQREGISQ